MSAIEPIVPRRAIGREEALLQLPPGWHWLVHRAYDVLERAPRTAVGRVVQLQGRLVIACSSRPVPGHVVWRLAAVERLSAHVCQVCGLRGRLIPVAESIHWLVDEPHVLCPYHEWRERAGDTIEEMLDERLRVISRAPDCMQELLVGDLTQIAAAAFRDAIVWLGSTVVTLDDSGYVREHRVAWVLQHASAEQLRACEPSDLAPLFTWDDPDVREAALGALTLLRPWPAFQRRTTGIPLRL